MRSRIVKAYDVRRDEILGCAERLFAAAGYGRATVNAIIESTGIAKGTFYHYFASKEDLLNGLIERIASRILAAMDVILRDNAPAADKLRRIHEAGASIKAAHSVLLTEYLRVFYRPENLLARHKMMERMLRATIPVYEQVIRQGIDEGSFDAAHPREAAEFLLSAWRGLGDSVAALLLDSEGRQEALPQAMQEALRRLDAYDGIAERVLGASPGTLRLTEAARPALEALRESLTPASPAPGATGGAS
jgi:AcrR family transcriptional regulator